MAGPLLYAGLLGGVIVTAERGGLLAWRRCRWCALLTGKLLIFLLTTRG